MLLSLSQTVGNTHKPLFTSAERLAVGQEVQSFQVCHTSGASVAGSTVRVQRTGRTREWSEERRLSRETELAVLIFLYPR